MGCISPTFESARKQRSKLLLKKIILKKALKKLSSIISTTSCIVMIQHSLSVSLKIKTECAYYKKAPIKSRA